MSAWENVQDETVIRLRNSLQRLLGYVPIDDRLSRDATTEAHALISELNDELALRAAESVEVERQA